MLRMLVLPATVVTVLAAAACASAGDVAPGAAPDASTVPPSTSESADAGAVAPGQATADALEFADVAQHGDPGVPGLPEASGASIDDVLRLGAVASWAEQPELIALSLPASSSCWASAAEPIVESPTRIVVQVTAPDPCEAPDAARTYSIAVPEGVDESADLQLQVVGLEHEFTLTLPAG